MIRRKILEDYAVTDQEADELAESALSSYREWARNKAAIAAPITSTEGVQASRSEGKQLRRKRGPHQ